VKLSPNGRTLLFATLIGGSGDDQASSVAVDAQRAVYVAGGTSSNNFPTTTGAFRTTPAGETGAWVMKFIPTLTAVAYTTLLGGSSFDNPTHLQVDGAGNAYVTGSTYSANFPVTPGAFVTSNPQGLQKGFVTKVNPAGSGLAFSTYFCGTSDNFAGLAIDEFGHPYLTGWTPGGDIPISAGAYRQTAQGVDAFVAKLNSAATSLLYSTYLGGSGAEFGAAVRVNAAGNAFAVGATTSRDFPTVGGPLQSVNPTIQAFGTAGYLSVLNPTGTNIVYSTYLGGVASDVLSALELDGAGDAYLAGHSYSNNFPTTPPTPPFGGGADAIGAKVSGFNLPACRVTNLSLAGITVPQGGGSGSIAVDAEQGCNWHALASMPFVTLTGGTAGGLLGSAQGAVNYSVSANSGVNPRTASITIGRKIVQIIQPGTAAMAPFDDVALAHPFSNHVQLMKINGITSGCSATSYCPDNPTTRGQMAVFLMRSLLGGDDFPFPATPYFNDVPAGHPFFKWIQKMREWGITTGCSATDYCPDSPNTRGQMAVFIVRSFFAPR
jgi:hypothetical protein